MNLLHTASLALRALRRNPTRALLTTLGIVIGIAAVIAMMEIGNGSSTSIRQSIESMGSNSILVLPGAPRVPGGVRAGTGNFISLIGQDVQAILEECPSVDKATPQVYTTSAQLVYNGKNYQPQRVLGTNSDFLAIRNWKVAAGRNFTEQEVEDRARVCLVGQTIVKELFEEESPIGCTIRVKNVSFKVIGVLAAKGANLMGSDEDDLVLAPYTTVRLRVTGMRMSSAANTTSTASTSPSAFYSTSGVALYPAHADNLETDTLFRPRFATINQIMITAKDAQSVNSAISEITKLLRKRHRLAPEKADDFWIRNNAEFMSTLSGTSKLMANLLLVVAMISLIVGGVGIMNIMLVSVTERTREIGLRMAVGARSRDILKQFLVESIILCAIGGIIGIALGRGAAEMVRWQLKWPIESSLTVMIIAFAVSAVVGIIFGFYPAYKASRLDPIEALRYE